MAYPVGWLVAAVLLVVALGTVYYARRALGRLRRELRATRSAAEASQARAASAAMEEQQLLNLIESVSEGILQVTEGGRIIHANRSARELLHLPRQPGGAPAAAVIRYPELRSVIQRAVTGQFVENSELLLDERLLLVSTRPLHSSDPDVHASGVVVALTDLTETRRLESVRRDFVANVSHELKTPLTSIRGYTETLLSDELPEPMRRRFLEVVHKNAERIQRIVDDLLDLSRLQSGGWTPELEPVDVARLAHDVWAGCETGHHKQINFEVLANMHPLALADPGGLHQVLSNLFDNAVRYTPDLGRVTVQLTSVDGDLAVAVTDTGTGIPRDALPRIFERFYRVDPARSREGGGTGLGLAIVRHLIERMGGAVAAESELGKGTTIRFRLPAATEA